MAGSTDDKRGYLLLHKSGLIECARDLTSEHQKLIEKGLKVIDLGTLEIFNSKTGWEALQGADIFEEEEAEYEEEEEEEYEEEDEHNPFRIRNGAKRYINPLMIWGYCRGNLR